MGKRKVYLYGSLAEKYGSCFELAVSSVGEAVRALEANFKGFMKDIREGHFQICRGDIRAEEEEDLKYTSQLSEQEIGLNFTSGDFHITPIVEAGGNKSKGWIQIIVGAVLIIGSIWLGGSTAPYGAAMMEVGLGLGVSLVFGGIATLLAPSPDGVSGEQDRPEENKSFLFNGVINTMTEGGAVALNYGKFMSGSTVGSSAYQAEEI